MREFDTGATRDADEGKLDYEGALSPLVLQRYTTYLGKHTKQADGAIRDFDNWKLGIPILVYMKSKWRHFMATWLHLKGYVKTDIEESLCGELFNTMGMLHEILKVKRKDATSAKNTENLRYCKKHNYSWNPVEQAGCWQCQNSQEMG